MYSMVKRHIIKNNNLYLLSNKTKNEIFRLVSKKIHTISELQREIGIGYKSVWEAVKRLEEYGVVKTNKKITKLGKIVEVALG